MVGVTVAVVVLVVRMVTLVVPSGTDEVSEEGVPTSDEVCDPVSLVTEVGKREEVGV